MNDQELEKICSPLPPDMPASLLDSGGQLLSSGVAHLSRPDLVIFFPESQVHLDALRGSVATVVVGPRRDSTHTIHECRAGSRIHFHIRTNV